jgi:hypothetical protein
MDCRFVLEVMNVGYSSYTFLYLSYLLLDLILVPGYMYRLIGYLSVFVLLDLILVPGYTYYLLEYLFRVCIALSDTSCMYKRIHYMYVWHDRILVHFDQIRVRFRIG